MKNIAVVGCGYWGKNLVRNFNFLDTCNLIYVVDANETSLKNIQKHYKNIEITTDYDQVLNDERIDGITIATPVNSHYTLAKKALEAGKHVLIEKPMTHSYETSLELFELAKKQGKSLMVDHTFLYTGSIQYLKDFISQGKLGDLHYVDSIRINLGLFNNEVNVLWDLAPHDLSIILHLIDKQPEAVSATGISHTANGLEDIAFLTLHYPDNLIVHINNSWVSPVKIRKMLLGGDKKMIVYDDMEPTEKIKIYDSGFELHPDKDSFIADYRIGDINVPNVAAKEALALMAQDFVSSMEDSNHKPISNAQLGLAVVNILDAAQRSIKNQGELTSLNHELSYN